MKTIQVTIEGASPLLQHRFGEAAQASLSRSTRRVQLAEETPRDAAEKCAYRLPGGALYFPSTAVLRLIREAGSAHKQRGSRKSVKFVIPSAVFLTDEFVPLYDTDRQTPLTEFEVDSRPVVIKATQGRVMRHRPRLDKWTARFSIRVNENILPAQVVQQLLTEGGQCIGVGDFRPEKGGPFGTFMVVEWKEAS